MIVGRNVGIMYGSESVYGTAVAATTAIGGKVLNFTAKQSQGIIPIRGLGDGRNVSKFIYGGYNVMGTITWQPANFTFLQYVVGPLTGDGVNDSTPWTLTEADEYGSSGIKSFTMIINKEDGSSDVEDTYSGVILTEVTLSQNREDGPIEATATWIAQNFSTDTGIATPYTPYTTAVPYTGYQSTVKFDATPTTISKLKNWSFTLRNNAIIFRSIGSRFIEQPVAGMRDYLYTMTVRESQSVLTGLTKYFLDDTSSPYTPTPGVASAEPTTGLKFSIVAAEGALTGDRKVTIQLSECVITDWSNMIPLTDDITQVTVSGIAKQGTSNVPIKWVD